MWPSKASLTPEVCLEFTQKSEADGVQDENGAYACHDCEWESSEDDAHLPWGV